MSNIPSELKYASTHEWARLEDDGSVTVGITDHAQELLGDVVYVELPEIDAPLITKQEGGVVESVKAASDIYAPLSGIVVAINEKLVDMPELINTDPYGAGWMFRLEPNDVDELEELLDADEYTEQVAAEGH